MFKVLIWGNNFWECVALFRIYISEGIDVSQNFLPYFDGVNFPYMEIG